MEIVPGYGTGKSRQIRYWTVQGCGHRVQGLLWAPATEQPMLLAVQAIGFPYGLVADGDILMMRAFRGDIVGCRAWDRLPGKPRIYELSLQCPRGYQELRC